MALNTSAMLEAALIGRPVLTVFEPEMHASQQDLLHFRYLLEIAGGLGHAAAGLDEHLTLLRRALGPDEADLSAASEPFVREFLRPHGLDAEATPIFVDKVEHLALSARRVLARRTRQSGDTIATSG